MKFPKTPSFGYLRFLAVFLPLSFVAISAQSQPTLIIPKNKIVTSRTTIGFEWNDYAGATAYHIQVDEDASFAAPQNVNDSAISVTAFSGTLATGKKYFWRVRANAGGTYTGWSSTWSFTVFSPSDIPLVNPPAPNLVTWYKADSGVQTDANGRVTQWDDASGNNNPAFQNDSLLRPLFYDSTPAINNHPVIHFPGAKQFLDFTIKLSSLETVFWVIMEDPNATMLYRSLLGDWDELPDFVRGFRTVPASVKYIYDIDYVAPQVKNGKTRVNGVDANPFNTNVPTTLSIIATRTTGNCEAENFTNDRNLDNGGRVWDGDLAELILFNEQLTDSQIALVEGYIWDKYAPAVNLGANIIYTDRICNTVSLSVSGYYKSVTWWKDSTFLDSLTTITVTEPGNYRVEAIDQFNRTTYDTVVVQFVRPNVISDTTICFGTSLIWNTGLGSPFSFLWQDGSTDSIYIIDESGDYYVTISDNSGCSYTTDTVHVVVDSFSLIADLGSADTTICQYQAIGLTSGASLAEEYLWNTGDTTPQLVIETDNAYTLTVTDVNGCSGFDSIYADVGPEAPIVDFTFTNVCLGFATNFSDSSTINRGSLVSWYWEFGDNNNSSVQNASHNYQFAGSYSVALTVTSDSACANSKVKTVQVFSLPQAFFSDSVFCAEIPRQFFDESAPGSAGINAWHWDFGDGDTSQQQNPIHEYDSIQLYNAALSVSDTNHCTDSFSRIVNSVTGVPSADTPILVLPKNEVALADSAVLFDWQQTNGIEYYTLQIATSPSFSGAMTFDVFVDSVIVGNLPFSADYYYWQVLAINRCGVATPSEIQRFHHFKPDAISGSCLWLRSDWGLSYNIHGQVDTIFDGSPSGNNAYQTDVARAIDYVPSIPELNGAPVLRFEGEKQFFQFQLIDSIRTVFWVIKEDSLATPFYRSLLGRLDDEPDFSRGCCNDVNGDGFKDYPGTDKFIYDSDFAKSFVYDGTTRVNFYPVDPLITDVPTQYSIITTRTLSFATADCFCDRPFIIANDDRYWWGDLAELIIYCEPLSDTEIEVVEAYLRNKYAPRVNLGPDIVRGYGLCNPVKLNAGDYFVEYAWEAPGMSNIPDTNIIDFYGSGTVRVRVKDIFGYVSSDEVEVSGGLKNPFPDDTVHICLGDSAIWNTGMTHDYDFKWKLNGIDSGIDSFYVIKQEGLVTVEVKDINNCAVNDTVFANIDSFSIQATLGGDTALCTFNRIGLVAKAEETVSYSWSTGDSVPIIAVMDSGFYSLTATNIHECILHDSLHVDIYGVAPTVSFAFDKVCINDATAFTDATTPTDIGSWQWVFGDGDSSTVQHPSHFYADTGTYHVKLIVQDSENCRQDTTKDVVIYSLPVAAFTHELVICANADAQFNDASTAAKQNMESWSWTFGDGGTAAIMNPVHVYPPGNVPVTYAVSLEVTTDRQCKGSVYDTLEIFPELAVSFRVEHFCIDNGLTRFYDTSPNHSNVWWYWDFGDATSPSFAQNPTHSYFENGTYIVTLKARNAIGCSATARDTITLTDPPVVNFDNPDLCEDAPFQFSDNTAIDSSDSIISWNWNFGDGTSSTLQNPVHVYSQDSAYNVILSVATLNECASFAQKTVDVLPPPVANFDFTPKYGAAPLTVSFINLSANATQYNWDFGDGSPLSDLRNPVHTYTQNGAVVIKLVATNLAGCSDTVSRLLNVTVSIFDISLDRIILSRQNGDCSIGMQAVITNRGTVEISSFDIQAHSSVGGTIEDNFTGGSLFSGREMTYPISVRYIVNDCEDVVICMDALNPNGQPDENPADNHLCASLNNNFVIIGPYPNPTGDFVRLDIMLPSDGSVKISNFNVIGQRLAVIEDAKAQKGYYPVMLDAGHLPAGVYILKVEYHDEERILKYTVR